MGFVRNYLIFYNTAMFFGWGSIIVKAAIIAFTNMDTLNPRIFYDGLFPLLQYFQTPAILEIFHALFGFVRSSPLTTFSQVFSRVFMVWGISIFSLYSKESYWFLTMCMMWSLSEVVRYSFYAIKQVKGTVKWIPFGWARYSFFFVLYPIGVTSEWIQIFKARPQIEEEKIYTCDYFNYSLVCLVLMVIWIPSFLYLYYYMITQRVSSKRKSIESEQAGKKEDKLAKEKTEKKKK
ncbi:very-long-chain (3r)-3-hydroxyacyl-coa dehydratase [Anaeramoeba flamelloides]|uniref:very-long-chain (3R)-3-hydroxyacyl-CoA dehydratase n=1 Tax=Anaeramoeba flamelloides TaxID=1746091 RepID=A0AAV7ZPR4_9EUKA|nr:very-long-chain (3r)-3-hydroxyacyl-coa dehydratase [Anaeramoeba flamelloides]|eukprot:Anaeramoba_flamelloidesa573860_65.p1 GENE.a573860_65~~a573860_65.p1  ORF type:complete len:244 (-),score=40.89 a573860_65:7-711(-)